MLHWVRLELIFINNYPSLLSIRLANTRTLTNDTFDYDMDGWKIKSGEWHHVTIDTNEDESSGISGDVLVNAMGSYYGGVVSKTLTFNNTGEVAFDFYLQNDGNVTNSMTFSINGIIVLNVIRPSAWQHSVVYGLPQGTHTFSFEYIIKGDGLGHKAVVDNFKATTSRLMGSFIADYSPPKAINDLGETKILRGYTSFQQMKKYDTEITFQIQMWKEEYLRFTRNQNSIFYFTDEFGIIYRGRFSGLDTSHKAVELYIFDVTMISDSDVGYGFADYSRQKELMENENK